VASSDALARPFPDTSRRALQLCVFVAASVAVSGGLWGVVTALGGEDTVFSNHERYLSGLLLAIGLAFWTTLPGIERKADRFSLLAAIVVIGGLSRIAGVAMGDPLSTPTICALVMELLVAPGLWCWQRHVAASRRS